jgi:uncharacterized protein YqgV (UPF0045/DUF77 family)
MQPSAMPLSVEISLYPLRDEFIPAIKDFIDRINGYPGLHVVTNTMSTQIFGEYGELMGALQKEMLVSYEQHGKCVFVCKFINGNLSPGNR